MWPFRCAKRGATVPWSARSALPTGKRLQQSAILLKDIFAPKNENHFVDLVGVREELTRDFQRYLCRFLNWIAVCAATDRRKRYRLNSVFDRELQ